MNALDHRLEKVRRAFPFEVAKLPLFGPDREPTGFYGLFADDTGTPVRSSSVSRVYEPHTTEDVLALAEAAMEVFPETEGMGSDFQVYFSGGHYLSFAPSREHRLKIFGTRDNIFPRINIRALYNGEMFRGSAGWFRDLCGNMAEIESVSSTSIAIRHDGGLRDKMDRLIEQFRQLATGWENLQQWAVNQESQRHSLKDFVRELYGPLPADATERTRSSWDDRAMKILSRVRRERYDSGRPDPDLDRDWTASGFEIFNAIQGHAQHDMRRRGNPSNTQRAFMASQEPTVRRAAEMLTEMAV